MSLLASLVRAYDRDANPPPFGFSSERISFCVVLNADGSVAEVADLCDTDKKRSPRVLLVPQRWKKGSGFKPNFLWENTAHALGVTAGDDRRAAQEHLAFREMHAAWLAKSAEEGLVALRKFLGLWRPEHFSLEKWPAEMLDRSIVFALSDRYRAGYLHDAAEARAMWERIKLGEALPDARCLVSGEIGPIARLHPSIKGVWGARSSGASLISFSESAYESYGHVQGSNAPISEAVAFKYASALNRLLSDRRHRAQIGDASTVFWADATAEEAAEAESLFAAYYDTARYDKLNVGKTGSNLEEIRKGVPLAEIAPNLSQDVRFHVLGLAPNAARLSVRFYWTSDFGTLTANYQRYLSDTAMQPPARDGWPPLWRYLVELASQGKRENVPPLIAGEWMRAILTGAPYPLTLLSITLMRIRADGQVNALRAAILKSVLIRNFKSKETPVALDPANTNKGYMLGRLFAVYEEVQRGALGGNVNATIKDKFYGAASATPQKVFRSLDAGSQNHFSTLRKQSPGRAVNLQKLLISITDLMDPGDDPIPASLNAAEQALFGIGYYHQRSDFFRKHDDKPSEEPVK